MDRSEVLTKILTLLRPAISIDDETLSTAPNEVGAYAVLLRLPKSFRFERPRFSHDFSTGWYVYAGSAYGPGGIRARLCRHFKKNKKPHWHVDHLTALAEDMHAIAVLAGSECEIAAKLAGTRAFKPVADGFGSSDCKICRSHLLLWREA
jgi:Uri superfamily endonuclease